MYTSVVRGVVSTARVASPSRQLLQAMMGTVAVPEKVSRALAGAGSDAKKPPLKGSTAMEAAGRPVRFPHAQYTVKTKDSIRSLEDVHQSSALSGVSESMRGHKGIIRPNVRSVMQECAMENLGWTIQLDRGEVWKYRLMGWSGGEDTLEQVTLKQVFETPQQAILWCERHGVEWSMEQEKRRGWGEEEGDNQFAWNILPKVVQDDLAEKGMRRGRNRFLNSARGKAQWANVKRSDYGSSKWRRYEDVVDASGVGVNDK